MGLLLLLLRTGKIRPDHLDPGIPVNNKFFFTIPRTTTRFNVYYCLIFCKLIRTIMTSYFILKIVNALPLAPLAILNLIICPFLTSATDAML